jgi:site-specific recombinase XerD
MKYLKDFDNEVNQIGDICEKLLLFINNNIDINLAKDIDQLIGHLEARNLENLLVVEFEHLNEFIENLKLNNYTLKSISRKINSIKTFFKFLESYGHVKTNPSKDLKHPKVEAKAPRILSRLEYGALRDACREDVRTLAMVEILLQTGVRISELSELKISEIDLDSNNPKINLSKKNAVPAREIPLNKAGFTALKKYLEERPKVESEFVFITKSGNPILIRNIRSTIDRYFDLAGIKDAKVNDLRHTFVAFHLQNGTNIQSLSKISGHKRLSTTEKYLEFIENPKAQESSELSVL